MSQTPDHVGDRSRPAPVTSTGTAWWKRGVIYQVYPRSFQDESGNGVGDLRGVTQRMGYLQSLGVSAVWISPFFKSPMKDFGYDVEDHRDIDPLFGSLADFDALIAAAHSAGIRILIDLVLSHTADTHPWFVSARQARGAEYEDRYIWAEPGPDGGPPNNWLSVFGGPAWTLEPTRGQYYLHNFLDSQPDLNFHCPEVCDEALAIARWWLERGVDGFRLDTVNFYFHDRTLRDNPLATRQDDLVVTADNPYSLQNHIYDKNQPEVCGFLESLGDLLTEFPGAIALGEVGATEERALGLMQQYQQPGRLNLSYTFDLLSPKYSAPHFRDVLARESVEAEGVWRCLAFSNHDVRRAATRLNPSEAPTEAIASSAMAMLMCLRGTPCIYQGEELGLTEVDIPYDQLVDPYGIAFWPTYKGRDGCRTPMPWRHDRPHGAFTEAGQAPWLPIPEEHLAKAIDLQEAQPGSVLHQTRALVALHCDNVAFHSDRLAVLESPEDLLVFERGEGDACVLCVFNLSDAPIAFDLPEPWNAGLSLQTGGDIEVEGGGTQRRYGRWSWQVVASQSTAG